MFLAVDNHLFMAGFSKYSANPYNMASRTATYAECHNEPYRWFVGGVRSHRMPAWRAGETSLVISPEVAVAGLTEAVIPCNCV